MHTARCRQRVCPCLQNTDGSSNRKRSHNGLSRIEVDCIIRYAWFDSRKAPVNQRWNWFLIQTFHELWCNGTLQAKPTTDRTTLLELVTSFTIFGKKEPRKGWAGKPCAASWNVWAIGIVSECDNDSSPSANIFKVRKSHESSISRQVLHELTICKVDLPNIASKNTNKESIRTEPQSHRLTKVCSRKSIARTVHNAREHSMLLQT